MPSGQQVKIVSERITFLCDKATGIRPVTAPISGAVVSIIGAVTRIDTVQPHFFLFCSIPVKVVRINISTGLHPFAYIILSRQPEINLLVRKMERDDLIGL